MVEFKWIHKAKEVSHLTVTNEVMINPRSIYWAPPSSVIAEIRTYHKKGNVTDIIARVYERADGFYSRTKVLARVEFKKKKDAMNWCEVMARLSHADM